jgi:hypothetical protein
MTDNQRSALYKKVALETDFNRLDDRIEAAERSMAELASFGDVSAAEFRELENLWDALQIVKQDQLASRGSGRYKGIS